MPVTGRPWVGETGDAPPVEGLSEDFVGELGGTSTALGRGLEKITNEHAD